jgi:Mn2+/Fe2+ NRAMP family transporter
VADRLFVIDYLGSTITSLVYASFTFIFFAIEAAIMALAIEMYFGLPLGWSYLLCAVVVIPLVIHGVTLISRIQLWTQPVWLVLLVLPYVAVWLQAPQLFGEFTGLTGDHPVAARIRLADVRFRLDRGHRAGGADR